MIHIGLFEGIGGFSLAAKWMGWKTLATCEIADFPRKVLQYYWPEAYHHTDIHALSYETINTELSKRFGNHWRNDDIILTGGFPCQPYSMAGKRLGKEDERHLWPEMLRAIREIQPTWIVGENVFGLINWNGGMVFDEVQADLEAQGYEVQPYVLPAAAVNAPHRRDRVWFVAYSNNNGWRSEQRKEQSSFGQQWNFGTRNNEWVRANNEEVGNAADTDKVRFYTRDSQKKSKLQQGLRPKTLHGIPCWKAFPTFSPICHGDDGLSDRLDSITFSKWRTESIKAGGNAIVPQVALQIFKAIEQYEKQLIS